MRTSDRNLSADAVKGLMILLVIFHHSCLLPFIHHGYLGVDVFFVISGFYLMRHYSFNKGTTAVQYTAERVRKTYLPYLFAFILACALDCKRLVSFQGFDGFVETFAPVASFLTLTEGLEFLVHTPIILTGGWFLSVLIIGGFLLYGLIDYDERLATKVILPFGIIAGYTFLFTRNNASVESWYAVGAVSMPLLRGCADMGTGILMCSAIQNNQEWINKKRKSFTILSLVSLILFALMVITRKAFDCFLVIIIPMMLMGVLIPESPLNSFYKKWRPALLPRLGALSLELFLIHYPVIHIVHSGFKYLNIPLKAALLIPADVVSIILAAIVLRWLCRFILSRNNQLSKA